jgi:acyl-CoA thioester hydrolase
VARYTALVPMRWSDMDAYGHVNNVQFLTYLEEARIDMLRAMVRETGHPEDQDQVASGVLVAHSAIRYLRPLVHRHAPVPIDVWVTKIGGASFDLAYEVHDEAGTVVYARATSVMVPYDFARERPRRLGAAERGYMQRYLETDECTPAPSRAASRIPWTVPPTAASAAAPTPPR